MARNMKTEEAKSAKVEGKNIAKAKGWFSARHQTDEAHKEAQLDRKIKEEGRGITALANSELAMLRTPLEQLKLLDERLGFLVGAQKERKKLYALLNMEQRAEYTKRIIKYAIKEVKKSEADPISYIDRDSGIIFCFSE